MSSGPDVTMETLALNGGKPYVLRSGVTIPRVDLVYETYGTLNAERDNAILIFHALSGSPHLTGRNRKGPPGPAGRFWTEECQVGWWDAFVGPGKAIDTGRFFVICANYLGGCYGTTGPSSLHPETGKPYGSTFPHLTAADIVDSQVRLLDHLNIRTLHAATGASIGGLLCLSLATLYPDRVRVVIPIASSLEISTLQRLVIFEQALAIENDRSFQGGDYYGGEPPIRGLTLARMISHKMFVSLDTLEMRARREIGRFDEQLKWYQVPSPLESYMLNQGLRFVKRFDANTYLRILEVWHRFDAFKDLGVTTARDLFVNSKDQQWLIFSVDSDVCFYPEEQQMLAAGLREADVPFMHITVHSEKGHDSFLLEPGLYRPHLQDALSGGVAQHAG